MVRAAFPRCGRAPMCGARRVESNLYAEDGQHLPQPHRGRQAAGGIAGEGEGALEAHSSIAAACALAVVPVRIAPTDLAIMGSSVGVPGTAMVAHGGYR